MRMVMDRMGVSSGAAEEEDDTDLADRAQHHGAEQAKTGDWWTCGVGGDSNVASGIAIGTASCKDS